MRFHSSPHCLLSSISFSVFSYVAAVELTDWRHHYCAESIDLRLFFHSGWSS